MFSCHSTGPNGEELYIALYCNVPAQIVVDVQSDDYMAQNCTIDIGGANHQHCEVLMTVLNYSQKEIMMVWSCDLRDVLSLSPPVSALERMINKQHGGSRSYKAVQDMLVVCVWGWGCVCFCLCTCVSLYGLCAHVSLLISHSACSFTYSLLVPL